MKSVILVIGLAVLGAHYLPVAALSREVARRSRIEADTAAKFATLPENADSVRLLKLYH